MVNKLPALVVLVTSLAGPANIVASSAPQQQASANYSISDIASLLAKRGNPLYFAANGEIVRVRYSTVSQSIDINVIKAPEVGEALREISAEDSLTSRFSGNPPVDLYLICKGNQFGDDDKDQYSPIDEPLQQGWKIGSDGKNRLNDYLQQTGNLLNRR